ncbi:MAG: MerR family transcriptional regulator [Gammaproteobacteria bacterium]|nr:MerR family transcriptional regulator [Gammaproteobacteria bacterium]
MDFQQPSRLLSIGEFAAATQLSPKALRLYDEQGLLRPAAVETSNGYRYYRDDQIALGRLIRTLRDMELPLADVAAVVADSARAEALLYRFAQEGEQRFARQKRALQAALTLLRNNAPTEGPAISERKRSATMVAVWPFLGERRALLERFRGELTAGYAVLAQAGVAPAGEPFCVLIDPISDDEGRLEAAIPIMTPVTMPNGIATRQLPARDAAFIGVQFTDAATLDLTASLDTLFDWFDRRGYRAVEPPAVSFITNDHGSRAEITWAYEPVLVSSHLPR